MKIVTSHNQCSPLLEISLGVREAGVLIEAVARRVLALCDQDAVGQITQLDGDIIDVPSGFGMDISITEPDSLIGALQQFHAQTIEDISTVMDSRNGSKPNTKWKSAVRRRFKVGRTALAMADTLNASQAKQDGEIMDEIARLGVYEGPNPYGESIKEFSRTCRSDLPPSSRSICASTQRRQRRYHHFH